MSLMLIFGPIGTTEIIIVLAILLLLFGGRKIPELAKGLGKGIKEFRHGMRDGTIEKQNDSAGELPPDRRGADSSDDDRRSSDAS
ncbi:MAG: twin-arginine translocase TatA/TatE family subunit [Candidatus Eisenbacteria bacterium]|nr:twin-arginine translocase TatA/TatE family subunit [Candidatus Eisenbacteria bacterium]